MAFYFNACIDERLLDSFVTCDAPRLIAAIPMYGSYAVLCSEGGNHPSCVAFEYP